MPTYQYTCTACGEPLEAVQSFSDAALTECPACGGRLRKVYGAVGVVFKGSGFYKTDSRTSSSGGGASSSSSGSSESSASSPSTTSSTSSTSGSSGTSGGSTTSSSGTSSTAASKSA